MTINQLRREFGEWVIDDLRLHTDKTAIPFQCSSPNVVDRKSALVAMYLRALECAETFCLLHIGESAQVRVWLQRGILYR